jgi:pimeloyl-ACP methyl ester carboxylesterase
MPKAPVNGIELYYESHGEGPAMVFAHQRAGNHMSWWQQVPVFRKDYRCIIFDQRGYGASVEPPGGPGTGAFVEDLRQLLDYLGVERTFLVAHALGGLTCLGFALAYPERSLGLILGNATGGVGAPTVVRAITGLDLLPADDVPRTLSASFIDRHPDRTFLYQEIAGLNPELNLDIREGSHGSGGPQAADLAKLAVPTLLIVGAESLIHPVRAIRALQQLIPGSRLEIVEGSAHSTYFERPEVFNRLVGEFIDGVLAGKPASAD